MRLKEMVNFLGLDIFIQMSTYNVGFWLRRPTLSRKLEPIRGLCGNIQILQYSISRPKVGPLSRRQTLKFPFSPV